VLGARSSIGDDAWIDIEGYIGARAQVAETVYRGRRLVVRRTVNTCEQPMFRV
jgi:hypothetical protein